MMDTPNTLNSGMCRCCSSEGTFKDIKTKYHWMGEEEVYADMLTDCFDIKIEIPEGMDNGICEVCITQLRNAANFKKQVLHTEEQFKRRLQNKDIKNPIKLESLDDSVGSDHLSDPDYSGNEYEVPIKEEIEEKPKAKKRSVQATTSRAKKPKTEPESSSQQITIEIVSSSHEPGALPHLLIDCELKEPSAADESKDRGTKLKRSSKVKSNKRLDLTARFRAGSEIKKHQQNFEIVMRCSNATPTRGFGGLGYSCYFCSVQFRDPAHLKTHTMDYHQDFKLSPDKKRPQLDSYSIKLDITSLTCKMCLQPFEDLNLLMDHLRLDHAQPIHTDIKSYIMPVRFGSGPLKCVLCDMEFNAFLVLVEHMNIHFRNHICKICDAGFINKVVLKRHMRKHETGDFPCDQCGKLFNSAAKLKSHTRSVHMKTKRNKCPYCYEMFTSFNTKKDHMEREHGVAVQPVKCNVCNKTFKHQNVLSNHKKRQHLIDKRFKCTICSKQFNYSSCLKKHMVAHTGTPDFKCDICGTAVRRQSTLNQHMRIHTDDRRYKCDHCGSAFLRKSDLKTHLHSTHGMEMK